MKRFLEELFSQILIDQVLNQMYHLLKWLNTAPWQALCA